MALMAAVMSKTDRFDEELAPVLLDAQAVGHVSPAGNVGRARPTGHANVAE